MYNIYQTIVFVYRISYVVYCPSRAEARCWILDTQKSIRRLFCYPILFLQNKLVPSTAFRASSEQCRMESICLKPVIFILPAIPASPAVNVKQSQFLMKENRFKCLFYSHLCVYYYLRKVGKTKPIKTNFGAFGGLAFLETHRDWPEMKFKLGNPKLRV